MEVAYLAQMKKGFVVKVAGLLMLIQVLSRVLGYARDVVLLNIFGRNFTTDAFYAAFSIPDFIYNILIGGVITAAFIPVFSYYLEQNEIDKAYRTSSIFTSWVLLLMGIMIVLSFFFTQQLLGVLTQYTADQMWLPVALTRITLLQALFMAMSAIATGVLQSYQHFTWPAIGVLLYNVFIILFGVILIKPIEALFPGYGVAGFSVGVVAGAFMTLAVQGPTLKKVGFRYKPCLDIHDEGFRKMVKLIIPAMIGLSVSQINALVTQYLATGLDEGMLTALKTANRFMQLPIGVFASSIAIAIFPTMTKQAAGGDFPEMKKSMSTGLRTSLYLIIPSAVGMIMLREPIIRLLYEFSGEFTAYDTMITGQALLWYCIGLVGYGAIPIVLRGFYSIQNTLLPLLISIAAIFLNVILSLMLVGPMGHQGLALAYSLAGIGQCGLLLVVLRRKIGPMGLKDMGKCIIQICIASLAMALAVWGAVELFAATLGVASKLYQLLQVGVAVVVGIIVYILITAFMKMEEFTLAKNVITRRLHRKKEA